MATTFQKVANNAIGTLNTTMNASVTSVVLESGEGALFPASGSFHISIGSEILICTSRSSDTLTVSRAAESTSAAIHTAGVSVALNIISKHISDLNTAVNAIETVLASSGGLSGSLGDETGSGALVFATSPTLVTPALGTPASGVLTNTTGYTGDTALVTTGVLNSGSINTSFGTINNNAAITGTTVTGSTALVGGTIAGTSGTFSGIVDITLATDATDATGDTGALRTEGGASIAKKLYVGTDLDVTGNTTLNGNVTLGNHIDDVITITGSIAGANAVIFEGNSADGSETTLAVVDPTSDHTVYMPNQGGYLGVFDAASTTQITATPAEINLIDGGTARGTTAIADGDGVLINDGGTMRMTTVQTLAAYLDDEITAMPNLVTTGALTTGSIASGFGTINNGSNTITTTGALASGAHTVGATALVSAHASGDDLVIDNGVAGGISLLSATTGSIMFGDAADNDIGMIQYVHASNQLRFNTNATEQLRIDTNGNILMKAGQTLSFDGVAGSRHTYIYEQSDNVLQFFTGGTHGLQINASQDIWIPNGSVLMAPTEKLYFDNGNDTYIYEESADDLHFVVGDEIMLQIDAGTAGIGAFAVGNNATPAAGTVMRVGHDYGELAATSMYGQIVSTTIYDATNANIGNTATGIYAEPNIKSNNTANWTGATAVRGVQSEPTIEGSGTITGLVGFYAGNPYKGGSATITNQYGVYIESLTSATNNYAIYTNTGHVRFGERIIIDGNNGILIEDAGKWGFSYGTQVAGYLAIGDTSVYNGVEIVPGGTIKTRFTAAGEIFLGAPAASGNLSNANITVGLTINQEANDDSGFALKANAVNHAMTNRAEADTYFMIGKTQAASGGALLRGFKDADGITGAALQLEGDLGEAADTTDTASSYAVVNIIGKVTDAGTANVEAVADAGNMASFSNGGEYTRWLIKGNGDVHQTTDAHTALDDMADAELIRAYEVERAPDQVIKDRWDDIVRYNEADLIAAGIFGVEGRKGLTNTSQLMRLHSGAIWQGHAAHMSLAEKVDELEVELIEAKRQLAAISA